MSKAVLLGPYVGDFTQEILVFRPHIRYITETIDSDTDIYISSHSNRSFLYDWIDPSMFIPIYAHISRNEPGQVGFIYDEITKTEFNQITKKIKSDIPSDDVEVYTLPYIKNVNGISYYQKIYTPFVIPDIDINDDLDVVLILDKSEESKIVYNLVSKKFNVVVIGDMNNGLEKDNILLQEPLIEDNYLKMFNYANKAKLVVTNCPEWALICNRQGIPVFYWGESTSLFKQGSILNFDNDKGISICDMDPESVSNMISYCYDRLYL